MADIPTIALLDTPNTAERSVVFFVLEEELHATTQTPLGITLGNFPVGNKKQAERQGYLDYVLTGTNAAPAGMQGFTFSKAKTDTERNTPYRVFSDRLNYFWPDVLLNLYALSDPSEPLKVQDSNGQNYRNRIFERLELIDGGNFQTDIQIEEFISDVPWDRTVLFSESPQPTTVSWNFLGASGTLACLHPLVTFPELQTNGELITNFGTQTKTVKSRNLDIFPATNHTKWKSHVFYDHQEFVNGVWYRVRKTAYPPPVPKSRIQ